MPAREHSDDRGDRVPAVQVRRTRNDADMDAGCDLVLHVSAACGFPDPRVWPAPLLGPHTRQRQLAAESVWLARAGGVCVGHGLVTAVPGHADLAQLPDLARPAAAGLLFELGGLAVHPAWQGRGIGRALRDARLAHVTDAHPGAVLVTVTWPGGPSDHWYARHWQPLGAVASTRDQLVHAYTLTLPSSSPRHAVSRQQPPPHGPQ